MKDKWHTLSERMLKTGKFMESRVTPESLMNAYLQKRSVLLEDDTNIIAYAGVWDTPEPRWFELGAIWVLDEHRGKRLASGIYVERLKLVPSSYSVCSITSSEQAAHLAIKHGFREINKDEWFAVVPWAVSCGPCDRTIPGGFDHKLNCPYRAEIRPEIGICRMFARNF